MYQQNVNPNKVLIWEHQRTNLGLEKIAKDGRLGNLAPAPVFELPRRYKHLGDYVLLDSHNRREAARRNNVDLPVIVVESAAGDFRHVEQYADPFFYEQDEGDFQEMVDDTVDNALKYFLDSLAA